MCIARGAAALYRVLTYNTVDRFVPTLWIQNLLRKLHKEKHIDSIQLELLFRTLMSYRDGFAMLLVYDWITIPLVYTQVSGRCVEHARWQLARRR